MGDGVLAYFGWPRAHEDDAERAVRAGLGIVEAVGGLRPQPDLQLQVRIGIATGQVVVGELIGAGEAQERSVVGETPNLAARLQALAEPDGVVIGATHAAARRWPVRARRPRHARGQGLRQAGAGLARARRGPGRGPVRGVAARPSSRRSSAARRSSALLLRRWEQAKDGEGQVVLLSGEPGIGKSRLTRALQQRAGRGSVHAPPPLLLALPPEQRALPGHRSPAARGASSSGDDGDEQKLDKLEELLAQSTEDPAEGRAAARGAARDPDRRALPAARAGARSSRRPGRWRGWWRRWRAWRGGSRCWRSTRTCTGSTRRRWSCWICSSSACAPFRCWCSSPSGPSSSRPGSASRTSPRSP